ncbi:tol-pal system protein YbgF [Thermodesulfobacteriota bacterium]
MKRISMSMVALSIVTALLAGCASTEEITRIDADLDRVRQEQAAIITKLETKLEPLVVKQAGLAADIEEIRAEVQALRGGIEEKVYQADLFEQDILGAGAGGIEAVSGEIELLSEEVAALKKALGIEVEGAAGAETPAGIPEPVEDEPPPDEGEPDARAEYDAAYGIFKDGDYEACRDAFIAFLEKFPLTPFTDNGHFWLGQAYYKLEDYKRAAVEYDTVVVNFPASEKLPDALLKQGFCFDEIGEKSAAMEVLTKVIEEYPDSKQAEYARIRLEKMN